MKIDPGLPDPIKRNKKAIFDEQVLTLMIANARRH
jgi:hypothetical protein